MKDLIMQVPRRSIGISMVFTLALGLAMASSAHAASRKTGPKKKPARTRPHWPTPLAPAPLGEVPPAPADELKLSQASPLDSAPPLVSDQKGKGPLREFRIFPAPFYTPETSLGVAVVTAYFFRFKDFPNARTSSNTAMVGATFNRQFSITDQGNFFFGDNDWYLHYYMQARLWPSAFFGVGPDVGTEGESFNQESIASTVRLQKRLLKNLYAGPVASVFFSNQNQFQEGGQLIGRTIPGTETHLTGFGGLSVAWDSRNSSTFPTRGGLYDFSLGWMQDLRGGPYNALRGGVVLKQFFAVNEEHIFAFKFATAFGFERSGELPFTMMPTLGGEDKLRGIVDPRFRDRSAMHAVLEYRLNLSKRWGTVLFGGLGQVAPSLLALEWDKFQPSAGAGLRYAIVPDERVNLRLDIATSATGRFETYIAAGESF